MDSDGSFDGFDSDGDGSGDVLGVDEGEAKAKAPLTNRTREREREGKGRASLLARVVIASTCCCKSFVWSKQGAWGCRAWQGRAGASKIIERLRRS